MIKLSEINNKRYFVFVKGSNKFYIEYIKFYNLLENPGVAINIRKEYKNKPCIFAVFEKNKIVINNKFEFDVSPEQIQLFEKEIEKYLKELKNASNL